jgi:peptide/nickel transport system permease protein
MTGYVVRRLLWMIPLLFGVSIITFAMLKRAPGDPVVAILAQARTSGQQLTVADRERLRKQYGLDKPAYQQYVDWVRLVMQGNLGTSTRMNQPVTHVIRQRLPNTMKLAGVSLVLTLLIAIPLGIISAVKQYSLIDYLLTSFNFIGISIPQFWLALMLLFFLAVKVGWFPVNGMHSAYVQGGFLAHLKDSALHYVLPVISITLTGLAGYMRYQRASMLEVLNQDYVRTARAKGVGERSVILLHAWRNSLLPIITLLGYVLVVLVEGSVVVENIFSWPGMGSLAVESLTQRDYPMVMAIVLLSATLILIGTLVSDILYALADPRVRYD